MNPTPDLNNTVNALKQKVSTLERLVIELTLLAFDGGKLDYRTRKRLEAKLEDCSHVEFDTTGQM